MFFNIFFSNHKPIHSNFGRSPFQQRKRLYLVGLKLLGDERIDVKQLCVVEFVPTLRHDEVNRDCLHRKWALTYCESTVRHSMRKRHYCLYGFSECWHERLYTDPNFFLANASFSVGKNSKISPFSSMNGISKTEFAT